MLAAPALGALGFAAAALALYAPALRGGFVSDDVAVVQHNPYLVLTPANVRAWLDPWGEPAVMTANYAPLHLLAHALERAAFGEALLGYHVVNVLLHSVAAVLLVALFVQSGAPRAAAWIGGAVFLVHPANVEAVAWIFQLKSPLALALATLALLLHPERPLAASALFGLALLAKPTAAAALPAAAALMLARGPTRRDAWLLAWLALFAAYAIPQLAAFQGGSQPTVGGDVRLRLLGALAAAGRYVVMGVATAGLAPFQEPAAPRSLADPWCLLGLAALGLGAARTARTLAKRRAEAAFWVWAGAAFVPIAQILPFDFPVADRYLYFILPGAIGAAALAAPRRLPERLRLAGPALAASAVVFFAVRAHAMVEVWRGPATVLAESARRYPDGSIAAELRLWRALREGDREAQLGAFEVLHAHRGVTLEMAVVDPRLEALRAEPRFRQVAHEVGDEWVAQLGALPAPTQLELRALGLAYLARDEREPAIAAFERAAAAGGPATPKIALELRRLRAREAP